MPALLRCRLSPSPAAQWLGAAIIVFAGGGLSAQGGAEALKDTDRDGIPDEREHDYGTSPSRADTDGDGLLDGWEVDGYWNGHFLEPLHLYGADPLRKDVFVEIDWMETADGDSETGARIAYEAAVDVARVFRRRIEDHARAGSSLRPHEEIRIHFDLGVDITANIPPESIAADFDSSAFAVEPDPEKVIAYRESFPGRPQCGLGTETSLYTVYNDPRFFRPSRRNLFYYVLIAEQSDNLGRGGGESASLPAFVDSFSDEEAHAAGLDSIGVHAAVVYRRPVPRLDPAFVRFHYSAMLLHELGHAFGLGHGGTLPGGRRDNTDHRANYVSVMNNRYVFWGVDLVDGERRLGLSDGRFSTLREFELFEHIGMGAETNAHVRANLLVDHIDDSPWSSNLDWNGDGELNGEPQRFDLNGNGTIDEEPTSDHDDWGWLVRYGFDGIGANAFRGCGIACTAEREVVWSHGDFRGTGRDDFLFARGDAIVLAASRGDGTLDLDPSAVERGTVDDWDLNAGDDRLVDEIVARGRESLVVRRHAEMAVLEYSDDRLAVRWVARGGLTAERDGLGPEAPLEGGEGEGEGEGEGGGEPPNAPLDWWPLRASDQLLSLRLDPGGSSRLALTNGQWISLVSPGESDARTDLFLGWSSPIRGVDEEMRPGERFVLVPGRDLRTGARTGFLRSGSTLIELRGPSSSPALVPVTVGGEIPGIDGGPSWRFRIDDCVEAIDLDGDEEDELLLTGAGRIGVVEWEERGPVLAWQAEESVGDPAGRPWSLLEPQRVVHGTFGGPSRELVVLASDSALLALMWRDDERRLAPIGRSLRELVGPLDHRWTLERGQRIHVGRFLPDHGDLLLFHDPNGFSLVAFDGGPAVDGASEFSPVLTVDRRVSEWTFAREDRFHVVDVDDDPEHELVVRKGDLCGVIDFGSGPSLRFLREVDASKLTFKNAPTFRRSDVNSDGVTDISDALLTLIYLFAGPAHIRCLDAADVDDSGAVDVTDAIRLLEFLFSRGTPPALPGAFSPGLDPTADALGCR